MSRWTAIWLVAIREIRERTRSKTFKIGTLVTVLIVCGGVIAPSLINQSDPQPYYVGVVDSSLELNKSIEELDSSLGREVVVVVQSSASAAEDALKNESIDLFLIPGKEIVTKTSIDPGISNTFNSLIALVENVATLYSGLGEQGLSAQQSYNALNGERLELRGLEPAPQRNNEAATGSAAAMIILFVFLTLYGAWILNGVIEEKTSRVVEVLLSAVRTKDLLVGKVLGIGLVGSIQGLVLVVSTFVARQLAGSSNETTISASVAAYALLWFVLGFALYAWAYACAGALASRSEDAQNFVFPLQMPLLASYLVGLTSTFSGPNTALTVMSLIPFTAPMTMLERMAAGEAPLWQIVFSVTATAATAYVMMRLAVVVFSGGILRSGQRVKIREAWKSSIS